ncbi:hypothetical protein [Flammeovirga sp. SJP92]|uniref:hypothetical protein n=1 Tax=Flammeovirga sp. SJP92 TaxID=1775430 RepID=UPI0012FAE3F3|nr:hypothetical protein [Flammeovirga sp. SJP92]
MNILKVFFLLLSMSLIGFSCAKNDVNSNSVELTGVIEEQGITTYQYGTHTLSGVALRSNTVNLDEYVDKKVTIIGHKVEGYPVDGGPDFIEVDEIK